MHVPIRSCWILTLSILLAGCTVTRPLPQVGDTRSPTERHPLDATLIGQRAVIETLDGSRWRGTIRRVRADSLFWLDHRAGIERAASMARVRAIETRRRLRGALDGFLIGSGIGVPLFAVTTAVGVVREGNGGAIVPNWFGYATAGASAAALVAYGGALIGLIRGRTVRYEIQSAPSEAPRSASPSPR